MHSSFKVLPQHFKQIGLLFRFAAVIGFIVLASHLALEYFGMQKSSWLSQ